jgi:hypothetical protein
VNLAERFCTPQPAKSALAAAKRHCAAAARLGYRLRLYPSIEGGIQLEARSGMYYAEFTYHNDGRRELQVVRRG